MALDSRAAGDSASDGNGEAPVPMPTRSPVLIWLLVPLTCHLFGYYWWYAAGHELREYLPGKRLSPERDLILALATCGLYALLVLPFRYGTLIQQAQRAAGLPDPPDRGWHFFLLLFAGYAGYGLMQRELNRIRTAIRARHWCVRSQ